MILALLIGCWCLDYFLHRHTSYIGRAFLSLSQLAFLPLSLSLTHSHSLLDRVVLLFQSLFVILSFFRKHPKTGVSLTYGDCFRRFALVSGPATGLIVGPGPLSLFTFSFYFIFLVVYSIPLENASNTLGTNKRWLEERVRQNMAGSR